MHENYWKAKYNIHAPIQRFGKGSGTSVAQTRRNVFERSGALWIGDLIEGYPSADETVAFLADAGFPHTIETDFMDPDTFMRFVQRLMEEHPVERWVPFRSLKTDRLYLCFAQPEDAVRVRLMIT